MFDSNTNSTTENIITQSNGHYNLYRVSINRELNIQNSKITHSYIDDGITKYRIISEDNGKKAPIKLYHNGKHWKVEETTVEGLAGLLKKGYAITPAIYNGKPIKEENIDNYWGLVIDFDKGENLGIKETLENSASQYANIIHKSPSWCEECQKHRLIFVYPEPIKPSEQKLVYEWAKDYYPDCDHSSFTAVQYFNGSRLSDDEAVQVLNKNSVFPLEFVLSYGKEKLEQIESKNAKETLVLEKSDSEEITIKVLRDINERITNALHDGDKTAIYNALYDHQFNERSVTSADTDVIRKWEGRNPFSRTNSTGTSFVISEKDSELPAVWSSRTNEDVVYVNNKGLQRNGGSIIDFFYLVSKQNPDLIGDGDAYDLTGNKDFKRLVNDLYSLFDVDPFRFRGKGRPKSELTKEIEQAIAEIANQWDKVIKPNIYLCGWETNDCFYFGNKGTHWSIIGHKTVYAMCLSRLVKQILQNDFLSEHPKVISFCMQKIKSGSIDELQEIPGSVDYYIPFKNGAFNVLTKQLESYDEVVLYNLRSYPFDYEEIEDNDPDIERLTKYWYEWLEDDVRAETLVTWAILNCQQQAFKTGKAIGFIGTSEAGKSTFGKFLHRVMNTFAFKCSDSVNIFADNNRFGFQNLNNITTLIMEEFSGASKDCSMRKFKQIFGSVDEGINKISIEQKGKTPYEVDNRVALTFDSEKEITIYKDDKGSYRRILFYVITEKNQKKQLWDDNKSHLTDLKKCRKFLMWALKKDTKETLARFRELASSEKFKNEATEIKKNNDPLYEFCEEYLVVDMDLEIATNMHEIYAEYKRWCEQTNTKPIPLGTSRGLGVQLRKTLKEFYGWTPITYKDKDTDEMKERKQMKKNGTVIPVITRVKLSPNID